MELITVVIPTYNRRESLGACLEAYATQTYPEHLFEIVVVDDGSADGTADMLRDASGSMANLKAVSQPHGGPAKARNRAIADAKGGIVLFTGDDCVPHQKLIEEHAKSHREMHNVAVLGKVEWHPGLDVTPFMEYIGRTFQFSYPLIEKQKSCVPYYFFYTSNISMRKEILAHTGGFDEDFMDAAFEDTELGYRVWKSGVTTVYNENAIAYHLHATTLQQFIERQIRCGRAAALLYAKHPEMEDVIRIDDLANAEMRENFYSGILRYYFALGVQEGLGTIKKRLIDEKDLPASVEDLLGRWSAKNSDRLFRRIKEEQQRTEDVRNALTAEIHKRDGSINDLEQEMHHAKEKIIWLEGELREQRKFSDRVKRSLIYRLYKSMQAFRKSSS